MVLRLPHGYSWQLHEKLNSFSELETERCHNVVENRHCFVQDKSHNINLIMFQDRIEALMVMWGEQTGQARFSENFTDAGKCFRKLY